MTHSEEKKQGRWNVISVSQVSVAIPHLTPQCSSLLQHCHGNNKFSCSHKFAQSFLWSVLLKKGAASLELHSWVCIQKEELWKREIGDVASGNRGGMGKCASMVRHDGQTPSPSCFICNSWSQAEPGHLKSMERLLLGFMLGWFPGSDPVFPGHRWERLSQVCCYPTGDGMVSTPA